MAVKITSPKTELTVLRGMCHKKKQIAGTLIQAVDESYFSEPESIEIFKAIRQQLVETGEAPSFKLIIEDPDLSRKARTYFEDSDSSIQSVEEANKAVKILNKYRQTRGLYKIATDIDTALQQDTLDVSALIEATGNSLASTIRKKSSKDAFTHFGLNNSSRELVKSILYDDHTDVTIPTGIKAFDSQAGGLLRGSLVTLGGSSGGGKSLLANDLAINMSGFGYKVVVVPLEMSRFEQTSRILANKSGLDVTRILQGKLATAEKELVEAKYEKWVRKVKKLGGRLTIYKPDEDLTIEEVFAAVSTYDCDVVIVDYISLLSGTDGDDSWQKLGAIARVSKINAEVNNRVNILLCQVNDDGKIRYARAISEHSSSSWIWVTNKDEREKAVGRIKIEQPKARNNKSYPFEVGFEWHSMSVKEIESSLEVGSVSEPLENLSDLN